VTVESAADQEVALTAAYKQLRRGLLAAIRYRVRDPQLAEDLLQDVFVKAVRSIREGHAPGNLAAWLHQVVRTTVVDHYRTRQLGQEPLLEDPPDIELEDLGSFQALALCMQPLVQTLPPRYRDALLAADFRNEALAAIAEADGKVTVSAIKSRVSRARAMLRERLSSCCDLERDAGGRLEGFQPRESGGCACRK